jgi:hypothetical protein
VHCQPVALVDSRREAQAVNMVLMENELSAIGVFTLQVVAECVCQDKEKRGDSIVKGGAIKKQ